MSGQFLEASSSAQDKKAYNRDNLGIVVNNSALKHMLLPIIRTVITYAFVEK